MAIKSLTYLDIPAHQRRKSAHMAQSRLREHLSDPTLSQEQRRVMRERAATLSAWVEGIIPTEEEK